MRKLILPALSLSLLLAACGGGDPIPPQTLHQGVWGWAIANPTTEAIIDSGAVIFSEEYKGGAYGTVAAGAYLNRTETKSGIAMMGPISGAGKLDTAFSLGTSTPVKMYFVGSDENNTMELYEGMNMFAGMGVLTDAYNNPVQDVLVVLLQVDDKVPTGSVTSVMTESARTLARQALASQGKVSALQAGATADLSRKALNLAGEYLNR